MKLAVIIGLVMLSTSLFGQSGRFKGSSYGQLQVGFSDIGLLLTGRYIHNFQNQLAGEVGIGITRGTVADVTLTTLFMDGIGSFNLYNSGRIFYLNTTLGLSLANDFLSDFQSERLDKQSFFTYGILGGLEAEFKVIRQLSFILEGNQRYYFKETFGEKTRWRFQAGVGIRYAF